LDLSLAHARKAVESARKSPWPLPGETADDAQARMDAMQQALGPTEAEVGRSQDRYLIRAADGPAFERARVALEARLGLKALDDLRDAGPGNLRQIGLALKALDDQRGAGLWNPPDAGLWNPPEARGPQDAAVWRLTLLALTGQPGQAKKGLKDIAE